MYYDDYSLDNTESVEPKTKTLQKAEASQRSRYVVQSNESLSGHGFEPEVLRQLAQQGGQQGLTFIAKSDKKCLKTCKSDILYHECQRGFKCKVL